MKRLIILPILVLLIACAIAGGAYLYFVMLTTTAYPYGIIDVYPKPGSTDVCTRTVSIGFSKSTAYANFQVSPQVNLIWRSEGREGNYTTFGAWFAAPLKPGTTYTVTVTCPEGEFTWNFTTASEQCLISPNGYGYYLLMDPRIFLWENGDWTFIVDHESPVYSSLLETIRRLNFQTESNVSDEKVDQIISHDKVVELTFRFPRNITISQWIAPEDRDHIKTDENGYRTFNIRSGVFVLEDNLGQGLEGHVFIREWTDDSWTSWIIQKDGKIDKSWIEELGQ